MAKTKTKKKQKSAATTAKKGAAKKGASKKSPAKKGAPKKGVPKKGAPKKSAAKKTAAKKAGTGKVPAKRGTTKAKPAPAIKHAATTTSKIRRVGEPSANSGASETPSSKRNFGLRGAAPWVARHAAKHAEELRKRNAEPPPPGSARATLRIPPQAEQIKSKVGELHQITSKIRNLRKKLDKSFYEIGELLVEVQSKELYEAKGYSSFESFLDREVELPRGVSLRLIRITHTFHRDTAYDFGLDRLTSALAALDGEISASPPSHPSSRGFSSTALPPKPPIRWDD